MNIEEKKFKEQKKYCKPLLAEEDIQIEPICESSSLGEEESANWTNGGVRETFGGK